MIVVRARIVSPAAICRLPRLHSGFSPSATLLQFLQGRGEHQGLRRHEALDVEEIGWPSAAAQLKQG
jgi:hypothetical protein